MPVPADYDGDGKADLAVWRRDDGTWYILQSSNGALNSQQWGSTEDIPQLGDYDGDHKNDLAVFRPSDGTWYILKSTGGVDGPQWGQAGDVPAPGDYNGDGKTDVAVFRANPSTGDWYVLETMNGTVIQHQLGNQTVTPVSAALSNSLPIVVINGPETAKTGEAVLFTSTGTKDLDGTIRTYLWSFGDRAPTSALPMPPAHVFTKAGTYTVKLTVTDNLGGKKSAIKSITISDPLTDGLPNLAYNTATNQITGYTYDAAGNLIRGKRMDGKWHRYEYDAAGRLINIKKETGTATTETLQSIKYDASNRRVMIQEVKDATTARTFYAWQGDAVIAEYAETGSSTTPKWSKSHVYFGSRLLATVESSETGEKVSYHHPDRLGVRLITNNLNTSVEEQATLPYGTALKSESTDDVTKATTRQFTSYERSTVTGLDYAVNRHYDPQQGRFTQVDPLGMAAVTLTDPQTLNMYSYCGNDPINRIDPGGQFWGALFGFIGSLLGAFINHVGFSLQVGNMLYLAAVD